jgi:hypothetical protein
MIHNGMQQGRELVCISKSAFFNLVKYLGKGFVKLVLTVNVGMAQVFDIFGKITKEEDIAVTDFSGDFNLQN